MTPEEIDPAEARRRILEELARSEYDDSTGFVGWLLHRLELWLTTIVDGVQSSSALQSGIAVVGALVLLLAVLLVLRRTGMLRRGATLAVSTSLVAEQALTGAQLREAAATALQEQRTDDAAVLALRALVRDLEERTLLEASEGMTAHEAATAAALSFPDLRHRLERAAVAFDAAAYSSRSVRAKDGEDLLRLAEYLAQSTPDLTASEPAGTDAP